MCMRFLEVLQKLSCWSWYLAQNQSWPEVEKQDVGYWHRVCHGPTGPEELLLHGLSLHWALM